MKRNTFTNNDIFSITNTSLIFIIFFLPFHPILRCHLLYLYIFISIRGVKQIRNVHESFLISYSSQFHHLHQSKIAIVRSYTASTEKGVGFSQEKITMSRTIFGCRCCYRLCPHLEPSLYISWIVTLITKFGQKYKIKRTRLERSFLQRIQIYHKLNHHTKRL